MFLLLFLITHGIYGILGYSSIDIRNKEVMERSMPNLDEDLSIGRNFPPYLLPLDKSSLKKRNLHSTENNIFLLQKCVPLTKSSEDIYKLQIHGDIINFSDIQETNNCTGKLGYLELFALEEIIIDKDLIRVGEALQVVAIAPKIKVLGERSINLNGAPGEKWRSVPALDGIRGNDGHAGLPGGPGGIFLLLGNEIENEDSLNVTVDGGDGGQGQDGGNGGNGFQGELPGIESLPVDELLSSPTSNWEGCSGEIKKCIIIGQEGTAGSDGGHGGKGGKGGKAGKIFLDQLSSNAKKIRKRGVFDGQPGESGMGGKGGQGGQHGGYIEMSCCENPKKMFKESISPVRNGTSFGKSGKNGIEGASSETPIDAEEFRGYGEFFLVVNEYKKFLRSHISSESRNEKIIDFYNQLITNAEVNNQYGTLALLDELKGMEEQYLNLTTSSWTVWYESLRDRIKNYRENRWETELGDEYVTALSFAYTAATSKANGLPKFKDNPVINLRELLDMVEESLNAVHGNNLEFMMNKDNKAYKEQVQAKIQEASKIIRTQVNAELVKARDEMQRKILESILNANLMNNGVLQVNQNLSLQLSSEHFFMKMLEIITTVVKALSSGAFVAVEAVPTEKIVEPFSGFQENQRSRFRISKEIEGDLKEAFVIEEAIRANNLHLVMPGVMRRTEKNKDSLKKINDTEAPQSTLHDYQNNLFSILTPLLQEIKNNLLSGRELNLYPGSLTEILLLDVSKWKVQSSLINLREVLEKFIKAFDIHIATILVKKLSDSFSALIDIYNQIQIFDQGKQLAFYNNNKKLHEAVEEIKLKNLQNVALLQYEKSYEAFKQYVFPHARSYLLNFSKPSIHELVTSVSESEILINKLKNNIIIMRQSLLDSEDAYISNHFIKNEHLRPYVWRNESYNNVISRLLEGEEVTLASDAREFEHNAVKFKNIRFFFKTLNDSIQEDLNEKLKRFRVKISHDGNSYYKCGKKLFVIFHEAFNLTKFFEPSLEESITVEEFSNRDFMVSPFAKWTLKLELIEGNVSFNYFEQFKNKVDLILEVDASYIPSNDSSICDTNLEVYYENSSPITKVVIG